VSAAEGDLFLLGKRGPNEVLGCQLQFTWGNASGAVRAEGLAGDLQDDGRVDKAVEKGHAEGQFAQVFPSFEGDGPVTWVLLTFGLWASMCLWTRLAA
jgi:hypothetical protein